MGNETELLRILHSIDMGVAVGAIALGVIAFVTLFRWLLGR